MGILWLAQALKTPKSCFFFPVTAFSDPPVFSEARTLRGTTAWLPVPAYSGSVQLTGLPKPRGVRI